MHRLWRAVGGRHHPDLHLNWLCETMFLTSNTDSNCTSVQVNGGGKVLVLQVGVGLSLPEG